MAETRETDEVIAAARDIWRRGQLLIDEAKTLRLAATRAREKSRAVRARMTSEHGLPHWPDLHVRSDQHPVGERRSSSVSGRPLGNQGPHTSGSAHPGPEEPSLTA
ncbi:hypothetical protein GCM10010472_64460 [Pseudonocardia halophobica]|uniref:Uncharacterized protein n=1 Tax=Pseudonocardia halophobica TaxID=29401 RepID=A0A9W6UF88_9PSEU|nr:hypothetical protein GCM10017577_66670 [Pseudonocardia halophobica]